MKFIHDYSEWSDRRDRKIDVLESQEESVPGIIWVFRLFIFLPVFILVLLMLNELLGDSYPAKGTVMGYSFEKGEWVGPPSMFTDEPSLLSPYTYFREDAYKVNVEMDSGQIISFLCFSCGPSTYKSGDSVDFIISKSLVGKARYSEAKE